MTSLTKLSSTILENRCCGGKFVSMILKLSCEGGKENSPAKNRPMVTAEELNLPQGNLDGEREIDELEVPTNCCMSGCANCVWIQYAEKLSERMRNSEEDVRKIIMDKVEDPNMRAFLAMELRCRNLGKS